MRNPFKRDPDPFAASRYGELFRGVRTRGRKHMQHRWQWYLLIGLVLLVVIAGAALWRYWQFKERFHAPCAACEEVAEGEPFNILLIGSDSRGDLTPTEQEELGAKAVPGARADTLIIGHVDPATDHVIMLQFPRDLYVPFSGVDREGKIGESLLYGRESLIRTVENLTGIPINRYLQVNIAGFRDVVDKIGGVDVCVPTTTPFDAQTGFWVTKPGTITFDGDLALRYVRSRHAFPGGDFDRIANQQKFLSAALDKLTSAGTLLNPKRVLDLMAVAERNLKTNMADPFQVRRTLQRFQSFDPARYEAYVAPNFGTDNITLSSGEPYSIVVPDMDRIRLLGQAIADNESPAEADGVPSIDPKTIRVGVYNGVDLYQPYASDAAAALIEATGGPENGLQIDGDDIANAPHFRFENHIVRYEPAAEEMARLVAAVIPGAELQEHSTPDGVDVAVIVGDERFDTEKLLQILPIPLQKPGAEPAVCDERGRTGDPDGP